MADEQTPPQGGRSRRVPVPMPILIGVVVAIGAGIYLMRRKAKTQAAAQPAAPAQPPLVMAGAGGGGIPSGYLYSLLQNLASSPAPAATPPPPSPPQPVVPPVGGIYVPPGQVNIPNILGLPLDQASAVIRSRALVPVIPAHNGNPAVIGQSPLGGNNAVPGTTVSLTLAG